MDGNDGAALKEGAIRGGDEARAAFEALWRAWYRRFFVFASSYRGIEASEREDAVSEALIAAFGALPGYDPSRPLSPWLYRVAANRFSDLARRAKRSAAGSFAGGADERAAGPIGGGVRTSGSVLEPAASGDHAAEAADRDLADRCGAEIARLSDRDRRMAMLAFYEGLGSAAIGAALGMPAGTVRWRLGVIRRAIRAALGEDA